METQMRLWNDGKKYKVFKLILRKSKYMKDANFIMNAPANNACELKYNVILGFSKNEK